MEIEENTPVGSILLDARKDRAGKNTLRAQAFCAAFYSKMKEYFDSEKYTDVSITCQDRVFRCHRVVLAAASEYFDAMFGGNFKESCAEDIVLHDISHSAFESVLCYMYSGMAPVIGDENVLGLLRTAIFLNLWGVEERCIHYLTQGNVPINYAVEIYLFALVIGNKTLISCTSQCILKHLPHVSKNNLFLRMSFEELSTLLEFALPDGSPKEERVLLNTICRWVLNQTCSQEEKESLFFKLTENVCFRHIPMVFSNVCEDAVLQPDLNVTGTEVENLNPSLHVYMDLKYSAHPTILAPPLTGLFSLKKSYGDWQPSHEIVPSIKYMRTVVYNNELYSFQFDGRYNGKFAFIASASVDFSENVRSLTMPPLNPSRYNEDTDPHLSICCQKNGIYACSRDSKALFHYNCEQDKWFPISLGTKEEFLPALITMCHNQLYIMSSELNSRDVNIAHTYDDRTGKLEAISKSNWYNTYDSEICTYRERIYVSTCRWNAHVEAYDPVANKWDVVLKEPYMDNERVISSSHRLASFENKLWMFTTVVPDFYGGPQEINISRYDSFADEWDSVDHSLQNAVEEKKQKDVMFPFKRAFTDVIVYKPPQ